MDERTQLKAYWLGLYWKLEDGVLTMSDLDSALHGWSMTRRSYAAHWIQVERGMQRKPFELIDTED